MRVAGWLEQQPRLPTIRDTAVRPPTGGTLASAGADDAWISVAWSAFGGLGGQLFGFVFVEPLPKQAQLLGQHLVLIGEPRDDEREVQQHHEDEAERKD